MMDSTKYILTKYERILRVEKVEYTFEIPKDTKNKLAYATQQLEDSNYIDCKVVDIPISKMLEEEIHNLRRAESEKQ